MRVIRGLTALLVLLCGVIGVPAFLVIMVGNPLPSGQDWSTLLGSLTRPDDGSILVGLVTVVAWAAWLVFTLSVAAELVNQLSHRQRRLRLPGLGGPQRMVSGLVVAVIALGALAPQPSHASPGAPLPHVAPGEIVAVSHEVPHHEPPLLQTVLPQTVLPANAQHEKTPGETSTSSSARQRGTEYVVQRGDDLWSLAERFYGEGQQWRTIAAANPDRLTGGPDRLEAGWKLLIPDTDQRRTATTTHAVTRGETLTSIAEEELGDHERWPELYEANRFQLDDPDELSVGLQLEVPDEGQGSDRAAKASRATTDDAPPEEKQADQPSTRSSEPDALPKPAPTPVETTAATPAETAEAPAPESSRGESEHTVLDDVDPVVVGMAGVGGLLAAAVVAGAARRRRLQLQARPVGRRIPQPRRPAQLAEAQLGRRQRPLGLRTLDLATRAIAAHCHDTGTTLPVLATASVADDSVVLEMTEPDLWAPDGFVVDGCSWRLDAGDVDRLRSTPGLSDAVRPYPALVALGVADDGTQVVADLESLLLTSVTGPDELVEAALTAAAVELACSPWAEELELILVGTCDGLPDALGQHSVTRVDDLGPALGRLTQRAASQRHQGSGSSVAAQRVDPDLADPWVPTIMIINRALSAAETRQLHRLVLDQPPVSIAVLARDLAGAPAQLSLSGVFAAPTARLEPHGVRVTPQLLGGPAAEAVIDLVDTTGRTDTSPAPWWFDAEESTEPDPPDNVTYLGRRFGGWARQARDDDHHDHDQEGAAMEQIDTPAVHPVLRLLGPVELDGAAGPAPTRAAKQCLEYCAWLLEYPGTTAQAMAAALAVAEGTRRSNMSRLRAWLGSDELDQPYLPDAYSGRILLHPSVSSDWQRLQILTSRGVNRTSTSGLEAALRLVRGAPLADAAPGQWHWAEGLRTDMISVIRDLGVELADRALADSDVELARWAATRGLLVAPGDELLLVARIKTEHRAGNHPEVERLTLQLAAHARTLEVDLQPETVDVLQEMMEGRVRARLA